MTDPKHLIDNPFGPGRIESRTYAQCALDAAMNAVPSDFSRIGAVEAAFMALTHEEQAALIRSVMWMVRTYPLHPLRRLLTWEVLAGVDDERDRVLREELEEGMARRWAGW